MAKVVDNIKLATQIAKWCENEILHETENMYLNSKLEICVNGTTHATVIGRAKTVEQAKRVMEKLERYPANLKLLK